LTKRRARGEGGLFQRSDGMWIGRVELPPGADLKRRQKTVSSKDYDVAVEKLRKLRNDITDGRIAVTGSTTVAKWLDRWLDEIHVDKIRPTTRRDYRTTIDQHIVPTIGKKRLDKLTVQNVRQMHAAVGKRRAAEKAHVILKKALKDAIREQMITVNVADMVDAPRYKRNRRTSLSVDVVARIIDTANRHCDKSQATRWAAAFLTGARQSELLGLRWSYVDLDHGYMDISWQLQQLPQVHGCGEATFNSELKVKQWPCGRVRPGWCPQRRWDLPPDFEHEVCYRSLVWTRPKTEAGGREVPIIPGLLAALRSLHADQAANPHDLVWHRPDGKPIGPREDYQAWHDLLVTAEVIKPGDTLSMHTARHTTATLLRRAGIDEQTRMEILGHAQADSQRIYAHADRARHLEAMGSLNELLG
jgi:integrase